MSAQTTHWSLPNQLMLESSGSSRYMLGLTLAHGPNRPRNAFVSLSTFEGVAYKQQQIGNTHNLWGE
jgi:hypothetical protein